MQKGPLKNTVMIIVAIIVIIGCIYLIYSLRKPKTKSEPATSQKTVKEITGEAYEEEEVGDKKVYKQTEMRKTLDKVKSLQDHGDPALDNLGKEDPFKL